MPPQTLVQRLGLGYDVLSDLDRAVIRAYRLQFELPPKLRAAYREMGMALDEHNADRSWNLPVPATRPPRCRGSSPDPSTGTPTRGRWGRSTRGRGRRVGSSGCPPPRRCRRSRPVRPRSMSLEPSALRSRGRGGNPLAGACVSCFAVPGGGPAAPEAGLEAARNRAVQGAPGAPPPGPARRNGPRPGPEKPSRTPPRRDR